MPAPLPVRQVAIILEAGREIPEMWRSWFVEAVCAAVFPLRTATDEDVRAAVRRARERLCGAE